MAQLIEKVLTEQVNIYINRLFDLWKKNPKIENCINQLFFNSKLSASDIIKKASIKSFIEFYHESTEKIELSSAESLIKKNLSILEPINIIDFEIFDFCDFQSIDEALEKKFYTYFLYKRDYYSQLDKMLLSVYSDYKKVKNGIYRKQVFNEFYIELDFKAGREQINAAISLYTFPLMNIHVNNENFQLNSDVGDFIFMRGQSFVQFYSWSHDFTYNEAGWVINVDKKKGEPVIYEHDNKYRVSNSLDKILMWNAVISTMLNLHIIHFRNFETWLIDSIEKELYNTPK